MSSVLCVALCVAACGGAVPSPSTPPESTGTTTKRTAANDAPEVDPIEVLSPADAKTSWLVPGRVQIELGATAHEAPGGTKPLQVTVFGEQGSHIRVAVRLEHARFSVWAERTSLMPVIKRDQRVSPFAGGGGGVMTNDPHVLLRAGARVMRLAKKDKWTQIRYLDKLQVEGWVPDEALGESGTVNRPTYGIVRDRVNIMRGAIFRTEPKWGGRELAVAASLYSVQKVRQIDDAWFEVTYSDGDVSLSGFVSRRAPPGRVNRPTDSETPPPTVTTNAKVASGTCLYTRPGGEQIGYIVGDRSVALDQVDAKWSTLAIDSPWGPLTFAARGPSKDTLVACAPAGSVPPPAGATPPTP